MPFDCVTEGLQSLFQRSLAPHQQQETGFLVADLHDLGRISDRLERQGAHQDRRKPLDTPKKGLHSSLLKDTKTIESTEFLENVLRGAGDPSQPEREGSI